MMDIVTIDFETYYSPTYSLSKMTTEAYVRSNDFEVIGVAVKVNDHPTDWYSGTDPGAFLRGLDYKDRAILCHNTAFDGAILSWRFGVKPKLWLDTMSMARPRYASTVGVSLNALTAHLGIGRKGDEVVNALGMRRRDFSPDQLARYASYCIKDVDLTYRLFKKLAKGFPAVELETIDQTLRMYTEPMVELDSDLLRTHLDRVVAEKAALLERLGGDQAKVILMSNDKFAALLTAAGAEPPTKVSATTGKTTFAFAKTDAALIDLSETGSPTVQALIAARLGTKSTLEETRTQALLGVSSRGRLPIMLRYYGAHTGRFSGGDKLNLQNLPSRGDATIRRSLKAAEGHVFIACDSAQIEARVLAYLAGQSDLVQAFRERRDVYSEFASEVYGRQITKADPAERFCGKTSILGLGYQVGATKLRETLKRGQGKISVVLDEDEARTIVQLYRQKNHRITALWTDSTHALGNMLAGRAGALGTLLTYDEDGFLLPNGMRLGYDRLYVEGGKFRYIADTRMFDRAAAARARGGHELERPDGGLLPGETYIYGGKVVENCTQALARIIVTEQARMIRRAGYHVAFQVHDENVAVVPVHLAAQAERDIVEIMSTPPVWAPDLPVACEAGVAERYGDC